MGRRVLLLLPLLAGCDAVFGLSRDPEPPPVPGEWRTVASGALHSCAIQTDGSLWCWGENAYGEIGLGAGAPIEVTVPMQIGTEAWTHVAVGLLHTCAVRDDRTLWCWGNNNHGAVGDATYEDRNEPVQVNAEHWRAIAAGDHYSCAIRDDRSLWCWGKNTGGQLGDGTTGERTLPTVIDGSRTWVSVSAGSTHACALSVDGELWCWGTGPLGPGRPASMVPVLVEDARTWTAVATGNGVTCGISDGIALCWGAGSTGTLGDGTVIARDAAQPIDSGRTDWVAVALHYRTACALAADGALSCWGENRHGEIGSDLAQDFQTTPLTIDVPTATWKMAAPGTLHGCAIDGAAHLWCTGDNGSGQRGDGTGGSRSEPVRIDSGSWSAVDAGETGACGVRGAQLWCWGENGSGQLGDGTLIPRKVPSQTRMQAPTAKLAVGANHTCDVDSGGRLWCWGDNREGQLLLPAPAASAMPLPTGLTPTVGPVAGYEHTCAVSNDGRAFCAGRNTTGQLGRGVVSQYEKMPMPVVDASFTPVAFSTITAGIGHGCGIATTTLAYCWGRNLEGQVGNTTMQSTAVAHYLGFAAAVLDAGAHHTCAVGASGNLACWGSNIYGQIGDGMTGPARPTPTAISGSWIDVSAGALHTCARTSGGELWCWGDNSRGTLGDGTRTNRAAPVKIGTATWTKVSAGTQFTCGVQQGGSLWCWGANVWGQLGDNTAWNNRFVQIGMP